MIKGESIQKRRFLYYSTQRKNIPFQRTGGEEDGETAIQHLVFPEFIFCVKIALSTFVWLKLE